MKNLYAALVLVLCSFISNAQIVNIPDVYFKNKLLNYTPRIDTNHDGEIQVSEALVVISLEVDDSQIINMTGINAFTNLIYLHCMKNDISELDIHLLSNLKILNCSENELSSIDLTGLLNLRVLNISSNNFTTLEINGLNSLEGLQCWSNNLTSITLANLINFSLLDCQYNNLNTITLTNLTNFSHLDCRNNNLTYLNISNMNKLSYLDCMYNNLTELNLVNTPLIRTLYVGGNLFTSIDFSNLNIFNPENYDDENGMRYNFSDCPNLTQVNIKNGAHMGGAHSIYDDRIIFGINNCPNLLHICVNDHDNIQYYLWSEIGGLFSNIQINSYCSFNPGGNYNTITGTFSLDNDNNGCDTNDYHFSDSKIKIDDSTLTGATYTNTSGKYSFFTQSGNFIITPEFENPYFTISPASATITFADSNNNTQTQNFCVTPNGVHNDVEVSVLPIQRPRPGFDATYQLTYKNKGNQVLSGNVNLTFNDAVLDFVAANPALATQSLNTLSWSYANLLPFESRTINFTLNVNSPQEIPAVNIGDVLNFSASIDPISGDETVNDNTFVLAQTVLGSYDPNDKTCLEGNAIVPERIGEYLHYLIRFQNSGTAAAENIVVKDIIDTTKFDITSLQLTAASHNYTTKITGNKVEFIFENINLPAEIDNEAASHGFVAFKIKTKNNLTAGNSVSNKADIYFDYNFPITTNEATTTFATLGVNQIENKSVAVFPNPVQDILTITSKGNLTSIQLLDVQGRLIATYLESEEKATINLSDKASGVYFVKIFTEKGVKLEKIVKK